MKYSPENILSGLALTSALALGCANTAASSDTNQDGGTANDVAAVADAPTNKDTPEPTDVPGTLLNPAEIHLDLFVSAEHALANRTVALIAAVRVGTSNVLRRYSVRAQMAGGDSKLVVGSSSGKSVLMSPICYAVSSEQPHIAANQHFHPTGPESAIGAIEIVRSNQPCSPGFTESGFYTSLLHTPDSIERDADNTILARVLDADTELEAEGHLIVTRSMTPAPDLSRAVVIPAFASAPTNTDTPTIVFAQDFQGFSFPCLSDTPNSSEGDPSAAGCNLERNGNRDVPRNQTISVNTYPPATNRAGALVTTSPASLFIHSRYRDTMAEYQATLTQIGGGAFFMTATTGATRDRGEWRTETYNADGSPQKSRLTQIDIRD